MIDKGGAGDKKGGSEGKNIRSRDFPTEDISISGLL